jgi:hypothetical protein
MKHIKRSVCLFLTLLLLFSGLALAVSAEDLSKVPIIECKGAFHALYKDAQGKEIAFQAMNGSGMKALTADIQKVIPQITADAKALKWNACADTLADVVNKHFSVLAYKPDGTPKTKLYGNLKTYNNKCLADSYKGQVYEFDFDWRQSPLDAAKELNTFIKAVIQKTGVKKVNLMVQSGSHSMGLAYLKVYGTGDLRAFFSRASLGNGSTVFGALMNKDVRIDGDALVNCSLLDDLGLGFTGSAKEQIEKLNEMGIFSTISGTAHLLLRKGFTERFYAECIIPTLCTIPVLWSYVPAAQYKSGIEKIFGQEREKYAGLIKKLDEYYDKVQKYSSQILAEAASKIRVGLEVNYGTALVPVAKDAYVNSDGLADVYNASYGATSAPPGKTLTGGQKVKDGHNHISPDLQIDASTGMLPESTWYSDEAQHFNLNHVNELRNWFFNYVGPYGEDPTVFSDPAHPQFLSWDKSNTATPLVPSTAKPPAPATVSARMVSFFRSVFRFFWRILDWWMVFI